MEELEDFKDDDVVNRLNHDNKVFKSNVIFMYDYEYLDANNKSKLICAKFNSDCIKNKNVNCIDWQLVDKDEVDYRTQFPIEYIELRVFHTKGHNTLSNEQTIIKYDYFNKHGKILMGEQTGVVEDSSEIFLHPPRMFGFSITELSPFPQIIFDKTEWSGELTIGKNMLKKLKIDSLEYLTSSMNYIKTSDVKFDSDLGGEVNCTKIIAFSTNILGSSMLTAYFHPEMGFLQLEYTNIDKSKLILTLTDIYDTDLE